VAFWSPRQRRRTDILRPFKCSHKYSWRNTRNGDTDHLSGCYGTLTLVKVCGSARQWWDTGEPYAEGWLITSDKELKMDQPIKFIEKLEISANTSNLESLGAEIVALKVAVGLIFQKLQDPMREAFLKELRQLNNPAMNDLAKQLEQFRI
ncbi:TPA: hypothetical protein ACQ8TZ_004825, partial [Escherichia coli]